jgi:FkbM family methyltransferase
MLATLRRVVRYKVATLDATRRTFRNWAACIALASPQTRWGWPARSIDWRTRNGLVIQTMAGGKDCWAPSEVLALDVYGLEQLAGLRPSTVLDIGANVGAFSIGAVSQFANARSLAVEPRLLTFNQLVRNVERNNLRSRVECIHAAAIGSRSVREVYLIETPKSRLLSTTSFEPADPPNGARTVVPAKSLGELIDSFGRVDLVKIDVEGAEYEMLDATGDDHLRAIGALVLEYHPKGELSWPHLARRLRAAGMHVFVRETRDECGLMWATSSHSAVEVLYACAKRPVLEAFSDRSANRLWTPQDLPS